jgi:hypothetical protein
MSCLPDVPLVRPLVGPVALATDAALPVVSSPRRRITTGTYPFHQEGSS